jgi:hypothetical protein
MQTEKPMRTIGPVMFLLALTVAGRAGAGEVDALLARIKTVGREGAGNAEAAAAWRDLVRQGPAALLPTLAALDGAAVPATNWLRTAVDAIAEHELAAGRALPAGKLEEFVHQTSHAGPARRLAYEWLTRADPAAPDRLLPGMLQDPSPELRRDAVARALKEAEKVLARDDKPAATAAFQKAFAAALDRDQVDAAAKQLKALGVEVDLAAHFGFIRKWFLVGPFDSTGGVGFQTAYPPEKAVDPAATYPGKQSALLRWKGFTTADPYGLVDLNKALGKSMGAAAYAFAVVDSPTERPAEIRVGSNNAVKIFLNGKLLFFREEYHHGMRMDQHVGAGVLKAGRNEILLKVCQNEQKDDWAQSWSFQLRVCDPLGAALAGINHKDHKEHKERTKSNP